LTVLGVGFLFQRIFDISFLMRGLLPLMLIGLGIYVLRGRIFKQKAATSWSSREPSANFALTQRRYEQSNYSADDFADRTRTGTWRDS
jgi:hypothetical protein